MQNISLLRCVVHFAMLWPLLLSGFFVLSTIVAGLVAGRVETAGSASSGQALELVAMGVASVPMSYIVNVIPAIVLGMAYFYLRTRLTSGDNEFVGAAFYTAVGAGSLAGGLLVWLEGGIAPLLSLDAYVAGVIPVVLATLACVLLTEKPWRAANA